jgi:hypothetical protein
MRKIIRFILGAGLLAAALIHPAQAQFPFDPAAHFTDSGRIERVDLRRNEIVIGDSARKLAPDVQVYAPNGDGISPRALKRGMQISFNIAMDPQTHAPVVTEIAIAPSE